MAIFSYEEKEQLKPIIKLARKNREIDTKSWDILYANLVERGVRKKYRTPSTEIAIIRQATTKPLEFESYNSYVEEVKAEVKEIMSTYDYLY